MIESVSKACQGNGFDGNAPLANAFSVS